MEPIFTDHFHITDIAVDCYGRLKPSMILFFAQEIAGRHCVQLALDYDSLAEKRLFWAVTRHKVQITRLPMRGETIRIETWPMPTTRVAYPRSMVAYDEMGNELFRSISLWVLVNLDTRTMILPDKSGVTVNGTLRGIELKSPMGLAAKPMVNHRERIVGFTDLDRNGHMNNTRYFDWIYDLLPSSFHSAHNIRELTACYMLEAKEGQTLDLHWDFIEENCLQVDAFRRGEEKDERIFAARIVFE